MYHIPDLSDYFITVCHCIVFSKIALSVSVFLFCLLLDFSIVLSLIMWKTWLLWTDVKLNLRNRVLGEEENNSFIALPGKGGTQWAKALKKLCPNLGRFREEFYSNSSKARLL